MYAYNSANTLSALKWLAHHAASAQNVHISLHGPTLCGSAVDAYALEWPELRVAKISLGSMYAGYLWDLARERWQCLLSSAQKLSALSLNLPINTLPSFRGLRHLCFRLPTQSWAPRSLASFAASVKALPRLETLSIIANPAVKFDVTEGDLDLALCPKLRQVHLDSVCPTGLMLPYGCSLQLELPAICLYDPFADDNDSEDDDVEHAIKVWPLPWEAWAARVSRLSCIQFEEARHDEVMDMLRKFTSLEYLDVEGVQVCLTGQETCPVALLDFRGCFANLTVLRLMYWRIERSSTDGPGVRLVIPAAWRLRTLVVAAWEVEGVLELRFQAPEVAAQNLEVLLVSGLSEVPQLPDDAFEARGLMLCNAECLRAGLCVYLRKELPDAPSGFAALFDKHDRFARGHECNCCTCSNCYVEGMGLWEQGYDAL